MPSGFEKSSDEVRQFWIEGVQLHFHTHAVRAMVMTGSFLTSGGVIHINLFILYQMLQYYCYVLAQWVVISCNRL